MKKLAKYCLYKAQFDSYKANRYILSKYDLTVRIELVSYQENELVKINGKIIQIIRYHQK